MQERFPSLTNEATAQVRSDEFDACLSAAWLLFEKGSLDDSKEPMLTQLLRACRRYPERQSSQLLTWLERWNREENIKPAPPIFGDGPLAGIEPILSARALLWTGQADQALDLLRGIKPNEATSFLFWLTTGSAQLKLSQTESSRLSFSFAIQSRPNSAEAYYWRAQAAMAESDWESAHEDCTLAIENNRHVGAFYAQRALILERLGELELALADIDRALSFKQESTRLLFVKSRLCRNLGDRAQAAECLQAAQLQTPISAADWISRALAIAAQKPLAAVTDLEQALRLDPFSVSAWQNLAYVHSEYLNDDQAALDALDMLLSIQPDHQEARGGRCVLRARLGLSEEAIEDVTFIKAQFAKPIAATVYQVGCAYAQLTTARPELRGEAIRYLMRALQQGYGAELLANDKDLDPIRDSREFEQLTKLVELLKP